METTPNTENKMSREDARRLEDEMMAEATKLEDEGKWDEAATVIAEIENLLDRLGY